VSAARVAIVGTGVVGAALADRLTRRGHSVVMFERGADTPYPHRRQFEEVVLYGQDERVWFGDPRVRRLTQSGDYARDLAAESVACVGGSATRWAGLAMRMLPVDFRSATRYGIGSDWPIGYDDLEPWYGEAEAFLGVSGTAADDPFSPPRSTPFPLPPFPLTADDRWLAGRLAADGIHVHTTPQARTRLAWDERPACMNYGQCELCPIGSRYSPNHHLARAVATGRCRIEPRTRARRVVLDATGRARAVVVRRLGARRDREVPADLVVIAAGAFESARLLLLSSDARHPDGPGNGGGHVGRHLVYHHVWAGHMHWDRPVFAGKVGWWTGQSLQFADHPERGRHGGVKLELPSNIWASHQTEAGEAPSAGEAMERFAVLAHCRRVAVHAEAVPSGGKRLTLSEERDENDDPLVHVHYALDDYDRRTYDFGRGLFERVARASGAREWFYRDFEDFGTFAHHMGTTPMGRTEADSVTDDLGRVHGTRDLYTLGLGSFAGSGGAVNPTLTAVALALRAGAEIADRLASR
jgi:choline dehydrogenase-like flavoprotein